MQPALSRVGGYVLKDDRRLGTLKLAAIDTSLVDELYGKLLVVKEADDDGKVIELSAARPPITL